MTSAAVTVTPAQRACMELIARGWLAPLDGFMTPEVADTVARTGALPGADGGAFPCPVTLTLPRAAVPAPPETVQSLTLHDTDGTVLGRLHVEAWVTHDAEVQVAGRLTDVRLPSHADFPDLRRPPEAVSDSGTRRARLVVQPGTFLTTSYEAGLRAAADRLNASLLIEVLVAPRDDRPLTHFARVAALSASARALSSEVLVLDMPDDLDTGSARRLRTWLAARAGATHLAAEPGRDADWDRSFAATLGLHVIDIPEAASLAPAEALLTREGTLPQGTVSPDVAKALAPAWPPKHARGFTVFLTGLSGAGKSTIARRLRARLMARTRREVTLLDGDLVRRHLSSGLGFSREDRDLNITRIGCVAAEITRHRGIAICAPIAPYDAARRQVRQMVAAVGGFVLVHVATPVEVCEARDTKGLYARARSGALPHFTGVTDPYEPPADAELVLDTAQLSPGEASDAIVRLLEHEGYVPPEERP